MKLITLGWNEQFQQKFDDIAQPDWRPARVSCENRGLIALLSTIGDLTGTISGKLRNSITNRADFPVVGDWVAITAEEKQHSATIHAIMPRQTVFSRKTAGIKVEAQVLAANIDVVFTISGLDHNFNLRRIERYLTLTWNSGAQPVVILNKADIIDKEKRTEIEQQLATIALSVPIHFISALTKQGIEQLLPYFQPHKTVALLGSSGVGKSTLTNLLLGTEQQKIASIRDEDSKGRHTTTARQLFPLPTGGMIIDTPGMRELQLWLDEEELAQSFADIEELSPSCRFSDCSHETEPGCAVTAAVEAGKLDPARLASYHKMHRELKHLVAKQQETNWQTRKEQRKFGKLCREVMKHKQH